MPRVNVQLGHGNLPIENIDVVGTSLREFLSRVLGIPESNVYRVIAVPKGESVDDSGADIDGLEEIEDGDLIVVLERREGDLVESIVEGGRGSFSEGALVLAKLHRIVEIAKKGEAGAFDADVPRELMDRFPGAGKVLEEYGFEEVDEEGRFRFVGDRGRLDELESRLQREQLRLRSVQSHVREELKGREEEMHRAFVERTTKTKAEEEPAMGVGRRELTDAVREARAVSSENYTTTEKVVLAPGETLSPVTEFDDDTDIAGLPEPQSSQEWAHLAKLQMERHRRIQLSDEQRVAERIRKAATKSTRIKAVLPNRSAAVLSCRPGTKATDLPVILASHLQSREFSLVFPSSALKRLRILSSNDLIPPLPKTQSSILLPRDEPLLQHCTLAELGMVPVGTIRIRTSKDLEWKE